MAIRDAICRHFFTEKCPFACNIVIWFIFKIHILESAWAIFHDTPLNWPPPWVLPIYVVSASVLISTPLSTTCKYGQDIDFCVARYGDTFCQFLRSMCSSALWPFSTKHYLIDVLCCTTCWPSLRFSYSVLHHIAPPQKFGGKSIFAFSTANQQWLWGIW